MKRSEIEALVQAAKVAFADAGWTLPSVPYWDITDFGLGNLNRFGLVLVNLATEPEYCEKLMFAREGMVTPAHSHRVKKEDIIARRGTLRVQVWADDTQSPHGSVMVKLNGEASQVDSGTIFELDSGQRITLHPGVVHAFEPVTETCVIGEVSTANDDLHDNLFVDTRVRRYSDIEEDVPATVRLVSEP